MIIQHVTSVYKNEYQWVERKSLANDKLYNKLLNWVSGEFDLYLQDNRNGLDVFFPGAKLNINKVNKAKEDIVLEINIQSKNKLIGSMIAYQIISIHNQLNNLYLNSTK